MKGLPRSASRGIKTGGAAPKSFAVRNLAIRTTGATGVGFGTAVIRDIPEGNILLLGAVAYMQFAKQSAGTITTFDGNFAIGSAATADATLSGAEADIIPVTAIPAAVAGVSGMVRATNATQVILDNTDGSLELNLNLTLSDASVSADNQDFIVNGAVFLSYVILGDD